MRGSKPVIYGLVSEGDNRTSAAGGRDAPPATAAPAPRESCSDQHQLPTVPETLPWQVRPYNLGAWAGPRRPRPLLRFAQFSPGDAHLWCLPAEHPQFATYCPIDTVRTSITYQRGKLLSVFDTARWTVGRILLVNAATPETVVLSVLIDSDHHDRSFSAGKLVCKGRFRSPWSLWIAYCHSISSLECNKQCEFKRHPLV